MEYVGDGNWECPKCGRVIPFGESDDDDDGESLSVYDAALIWLLMVRTRVIPLAPVRANWKGLFVDHFPLTTKYRKNALTSYHE